MQAENAENWKIIGTSKTGRVYSVSDQGMCRVQDASGKVVRTTRGNLNRWTGYLTFGGEYVHRLVARAFLPEPTDAEAIYVSHVNTVKADNRAQNLSYVTVKENNNNELTQMKRSAAHLSRRHDGQVIRAERDGEVVYYKNGMEAARALGVSHVLIYNCLNRRHSSRPRAKKWSLTWVPMSEMSNGGEA